MQGIQGGVGKVSQMDWEGLLILNMGSFLKVVSSRMSQGVRGSLESGGV